MLPLENGPNLAKLSLFLLRMQGRTAIGADGIKLDRMAYQESWDKKAMPDPPDQQAHVLMGRDRGRV